MGKCNYLLVLCIIYESRNCYLIPNIANLLILTLCLIIWGYMLVHSMITDGSAIKKWLGYGNCDMSFIL